MTDAERIADLERQREAVETWQATAKLWRDKANDLERQVADAGAESQRWEQECNGLDDTVLALDKQLAALRAVVKRFEWSDWYLEPGEIGFKRPHCLDCHRQRDDGHKPDCALAAALAAHPAKEREVLCYLVERGQAVNHAPTVWWAEDNAWTEYTHQAHRFATREEAEDFAFHKFGRGLYTITEHVWVAAHPATEEK